MDYFNRAAAPAPRERKRLRGQVCMVGTRQ